MLLTTNVVSLRKSLSSRSVLCHYMWTLQTLVITRLLDRSIKSTSKKKPAPGPPQSTPWYMQVCDYELNVNKQPHHWKAFMLSIHHVQTHWRLITHTSISGNIRVITSQFQVDKNKRLPLWIGPLFIKYHQYGTMSRFVFQGSILNPSQLHLFAWYVYLLLDHIPLSKHIYV